MTNISDMSIQEIEKQIFDLQAELEKKKREQPKPWRAERFHKFYRITEAGEVYENNDLYDGYEDKRYNYGNYYRTEELAERDAKELTIRNKVRQYRDMLCPEYKFTKGAINYDIEFNYDDGYYQVYECYHLEAVGAVTFDTLEHAQTVCNVLNADLLSH